MIIDDFKSWSDNNNQKFVQYDLILTDLYEHKSDNKNDNSLVLTYENSMFITQITIRNSGFVDIEIISCDNKDNDELSFYLHCMTNTHIDFDLIMGNYFDYIKQFYGK